MQDLEFHRISSLFETALAGQLSAEQHDELEAALRESPELRDAYLRTMSLHLDLDHLSRTTSMEEPIENRPAVRKEVSSRRALSKRAAVLCIATCLTVLAAWTGMTMSPWGTSTSTSQMTNVEKPVNAGDRQPEIIEVANATIFGEGSAPSPGQRLTMQREYILSEGFLALRFHSGARAVLKAPCVFSAQGEEKLLVRSGQCSVYAPPGAEGFELLSPSAQIVDLGTRFVVDIAETGETELLVVEGEATMSTGTTPPIHLKKGDMARVDPGSEPKRTAESLSKVPFIESLPDRVVSYEATRRGSYADELLNLTVQRGGVSRKVPREELIRAKLVHYQSPKEAAAFCTRKGDSLPDGAERLQLLEKDWSLVTGIINASSEKTDEATMTVEFAQPIVNGPGPEIVIFDLQLLVYHPRGDEFRLRSGDDRVNRKEFTVEKFDIDLHSPSALDLYPHRIYRATLPTKTVSDLVDHEFTTGRQVHVDARGLAVGIDLSDLGYAPGESLTRLEFLRPLKRQQYLLDPVLIVGLKPES